MSIISFDELMSDAQRAHYAVGYFECWSLDSLLAVADAAEKTGSPVILGFSGIYLPHPDRKVRDPLSPYAEMGLETCQRLSVPTCLLFNESPCLSWVHAALDLGFNVVMYSDDKIPQSEQVRVIRNLVELAHERGAAVEAELQPLAGVGGELRSGETVDLRLTSAKDAEAFLDATGVDALAVNVGQCHLHGRRKVRLDLERLSELSHLPVPLVLHGATSVERDDLKAAVKYGVCKINVGSLLKQTYLRALRQACSKLSDDDNPYEAIGSNLSKDVLLAGRLAMQSAVEDLMQLFGVPEKRSAER